MKTHMEIADEIANRADEVEFHIARDEAVAKYGEELVWKAQRFMLDTVKAAGITDDEIKTAIAERIIYREVEEGRLILLADGKIIEKERFDPSIHRLREVPAATE